MKAYQPTAPFFVSFCNRLTAAAKVEIAKSEFPVKDRLTLPKRPFWSKRISVDTKSFGKSGVSGAVKTAGKQGWKAMEGGEIKILRLKPPKKSQKMEETEETPRITECHLATSVQRYQTSNV